jgi:hypothetical protein
VTLSPARVVEVRPVGRDHEWRRLDDFRVGVAQGARALIVRGEAGIGKTVLCHCEYLSDIDAVASAEGIVEVPVPARAVFTTYSGTEVSCRRQCHVGLATEPSTFTPYAMADGT